MYELVSFYEIGAYPTFERPVGLAVMPERNG